MEGKKGKEHKKRRKIEKILELSRKSQFLREGRL